MLGVNDIKRTQGLAIVAMLTLHLFNRLDWNGLYTPLLFVRDIPVAFYFGLISDCCVALFAMCSGYALFCKHSSGNYSYRRDLLRLLRLLINYWVILASFIIICLITRQKALIGGVDIAIKHFLLISKQYNGAWWYLLTYTLIILTCPFILNILNRKRSIIPILSLFLFVVTHLLKEKTLTNNEVLNWLINQVVLYFNTLFPFALGYYLACFHVDSKIKAYVDGAKKPQFVKVYCFIIFLLLIIAHSIVRSSIVAPFTGGIIFLIFNTFRWGKIAQTVFDFLGKHSTNIWLTHMFFWSDKYGAMIYRIQYPVLMLIVLLGVCIVFSYPVLFIAKCIEKIILKRSAI